MTVDLILFMGQSNMAGRGVTCERWPQSAPRAIEGAGYEYRAITAQVRIPQRMGGVIMVSTEFAGMKERGLMKDAFHYYQAAYNEVGRTAGERAALVLKREEMSAI